VVVIKEVKVSFEVRGEVIGKIGRFSGKRILSAYKPCLLSVMCGEFNLAGRRACVSKFLG
jgi:hypothetical protein